MSVSSFGKMGTNREPLLRVSRERSKSLNDDDFNMSRLSLENQGIRR